MDQICEKNASKSNGFLALCLILGGFGIILFFIIQGIIATQNPLLSVPLVITVFTTITLLCGFLIVQPNQAQVIVFFGKYIGSIKQPGLWWVNPFTTKRKMSLRMNNLNSEKLKVNDLTGNPIEIAAVIVWRVVDSAKALFDVENYQQFVNIQCETAIRSMATQYPYDTHEDGKASLRGSQNEVSENLRTQVQARLEIAGVEIAETRISHLAYAPEIAQTMLRRQQAEAIIAARQKIVEGAVGMVDMALRMLGERKILILDDEKKASMTNNLLVALISDHEVTPVVNTGTLYS
jgi:regulator of protease activity HflC (stomatin/prohibitin superfamily)